MSVAGGRFQQRPYARSAIDALRRGAHGCNRGSTSYSASAGRRITLGPIVLTRMMCPPGSLSDRFVREVSRVRSYFLKDGELYLELPVDSGTLRFKRQG